MQTLHCRCRINGVLRGVHCQVTYDTVLCPVNVALRNQSLDDVILETSRGMWCTCRAQPLDVVHHHSVVRLDEMSRMHDPLDLTGNSICVHCRLFASHFKGQQQYGKLSSIL